MVSFLSDLGRNIQQIEEVMGCVQGAEIHEDPHDSSTFLLTVPGDGIDQTLVNGIAAQLSDLTDEKDNVRLLEAWPSRVSTQALHHGFTGKARFSFD